MLTVDVNAVGRAADDADQAWHIDPRTRLADPSKLDERKRLAGNENLRPQVVLVPSPVRVLEDRISRYAAAGAPAVARICPGPGRHGYPLARWAVAPIPEVCDGLGYALAVDFDTTRPYPWDEVVRFARAYPSLPVLALGAPLDPWTPSRALDATANLILESSGGGQAAAVALANLSRSYGPHRLAFGSGGTRGASAQQAELLEDDAARYFLGGTAELLATGRWAAVWR